MCAYHKDSQNDSENEKQGHIMKFQFIFAYPPTGSIQLFIQQIF